MQTATSIAFDQHIPQLQLLLASTKVARREAHARVRSTAPRYQAKNKGEIWEVVDITTGAVMGLAYQYDTALVFVDAMEAASKRKLVGRQ